MGSVPSTPTAVRLRYLFVCKLSFQILLSASSGLLTSLRGRKDRNFPSILLMWPKDPVFCHVDRGC